MMKVATVLGSLAIVVGLSLILIDEDKDAYCIEQWFANTQDLFENATAIFQSSPVEPEILKPDTLESELQALLPKEDGLTSSKPINWHYEDDRALEPIAANSEDANLLPDLFQPKNDTTPTVSGQLHLDEADNIVGAEVEVAIPTN